MSSSVISWSLYYKHLMTGPKGNSEFCFPKTLNVPRSEAEGNINEITYYLVSSNWIYLHPFICHFQFPASNYWYINTAIATRLALRMKPVDESIDFQWTWEKEKGVKSMLCIIVLKQRHHTTGFPQNVVIKRPTDDWRVITVSSDNSKWNGKGWFTTA